MTENNFLLKKISMLSGLRKVKSKENNQKVDYRLVALAVLSVILIIQTFQLGMIKAELKKDRKTVSAQNLSQENYGSLPTMSGGC
ncbi:MAG TPA: hypothetical protein VJK25_03875 [Patescibacteria group bacterium]|nr:hypothetical protein [Patescibacteria group bacterium]